MVVPPLGMITMKTFVLLRCFMRKKIWRPELKGLVHNCLLSINKMIFYSLHFIHSNAFFGHLFGLEVINLGLRFAGAAEV